MSLPTQALSPCSTCGTPSSPLNTHCQGCGLPFSMGMPAQGASTTTHLLPPGTVLDGKYRIDGELGSGGFGITYDGYDIALSRRVAIKELFVPGCVRQGVAVIPPPIWKAPEWDDARDGFVDEGKTLARFRHEGIPQVFASFLENNTAYTVMEFVDGQDLGKRLRQHVHLHGSPLAENEVRAFICKSGEALEKVHDALLLHRDIKPDNIMVTKAGRVVVIDFGTAREFVPGQASQMTRTVSEGYAPLEQYASQSTVGPYTDIYALAATAFHLLTNQVPISALQRFQGVTLPQVQAFAPWVSSPVADMVERGLQMTAAQRPQTIAEFLQPFYASTPPAPVATPSASTPSASTPSASTPSASTPSAATPAGVISPGGPNLAGGALPVGAVAPMPGPVSPLPAAPPVLPAPSSGQVLAPQKPHWGAAFAALGVLFLMMGGVGVFYILRTSAEKQHPVPTPPSIEQAQQQERWAQAEFQAKKAQTQIEGVVDDYALYRKRLNLMTPAEVKSARANLQAKLNQALAQTNSALSLSSTNERAWVQKVRVYYYLADYVQARLQLQKAQAQFPENRDLKDLAALISQQAEKQAVEPAPTHPVVHIPGNSI